MFSWKRKVTAKNVRRCAMELSADNVLWDCFATSLESIISTVFIWENNPKKIASSQLPPPPLVIFRSNIVTLRSKKLPVVDTKYRGFWEREVGPGNNENKSMGKNLCLMFLFCFVLFCLFVFFFYWCLWFNIQVQQTFGIWSKVQTFTLAHHHLRYRQRKGLNNQILKNYFKNSATCQT